MTRSAVELAGRYRLEELLSRGGMGEVWRAEDTRLGREVAIKLLTSGLFEATERDRILREARLAAQLSHRNLVAVYDVGVDADRPYLVMEFLEGRTLREELAERGPLPPDEIRDIGAQVAEGLGAAHRIGIVHRDVKPSNLLRTTDGTIKVLDFGIARQMAEAATELTAAGTVVGTAAYVSPEQLTRGTGDHRSDLYALGCVLYELGCARPPHTGDMAAMTYGHVHVDPHPPSALRPGFPVALEKLLMSLLAKSASERPATALEAAAEFRALPEYGEYLAEPHDLPTTVIKTLEEPSTGILPAIDDEYEAGRPVLLPVIIGLVAVFSVALAAWILFVRGGGVG